MLEVMAKIKDDVYATEKRKRGSAPASGTDVGRTRKQQAVPNPREPLIMPEPPVAPPPQPAAPFVLSPASPVAPLVAPPAAAPPVASPVPSPPPAPPSNLPPAPPVPPLPPPLNRPFLRSQNKRRVGDTLAAAAATARPRPVFTLPGESDDENGHCIDQPSQGKGRCH